MTNDKEGWEDVNVSSQDKIEYEIENEEQKAEPVIEEAAPEVKVQEEERPKELEGLDLNNVYYKSSKYLIFNGSVFLSDSSRKKKNDLKNLKDFQKNLKVQKKEYVSL